MFATIRQKFGGSDGQTTTTTTTTTTTATQASYAEPIRGKFYPGLGTEFTAWPRWGEEPDHSTKNDKYIPLMNFTPPPFNYYEEVQKLIDHSWKRAAHRPTNGARRFSGAIGSSPQRVGQNAAETPSRFKALKVPIGSDWDHITEFEHVAAYSFRGDTRAPEEIHAAGGFQPPCSRSDADYMGVIAGEFVDYLKRRKIPDSDIPSKDEMKAYLLAESPVKRKLFAEWHFWIGVVQRDAFHLRNMTMDSFLKGYISTSRDVRKASTASNGSAAGAHTQNAAIGTDAMAASLRALSGYWVYAVRIESGFLLKPGVGGVARDEAEIAHLGSLAWDKVYGFACNGRNGEGTVYIRTGFDCIDLNAFEQVLGALSAIVGG